MPLPSLVPEEQCTHRKAPTRGPRGSACRGGDHLGAAIKKCAGPEAPEAPLGDDPGLRRLRVSRGNRLVATGPLTTPPKMRAWLFPRALRQSKGRRRFISTLQP